MMNEIQQQLEIQIHQQHRVRNNIYQSRILRPRRSLVVCFFSFVSDELVVYIINEKKQYYLQKNPKNIRQCLIRIYVFCYVWSFGGGLKV
jgi:amino acid permease